MDLKARLGLICDMTALNGSALTAGLDIVTVEFSTSQADTHAKCLVKVMSGSGGGIQTS